MFGGNLPLGSEILVQEHQNSGDNTEESTETEDDQVTDSLGKRRFSSEEGGLSIVSEEGGFSLSFTRSMFYWVKFSINKSEHWKKGRMSNLS
jgi:hypothetical protein